MIVRDHVKIVRKLLAEFWDNLRIFFSSLSSVADMKIISKSIRKPLGNQRKHDNLQQYFVLF